MVELSEAGLRELHKIVELKFPDTIVKGIKSEGLIKAIVERPHLKLFNQLEPFDTVFTKAASLMEAIIRWHPFNDGNKRTGLLAAFVYLQANGHYLVMPLDSVRFTVSIAENKENTEEETNKLIKEITEWLEERTATTARDYKKKTRKFLIYPTIGLLALSFTGVGLFVVQSILNKWFSMKMHEEYRKEIKNIIKFLFQTLNDSEKAMNLAAKKMGR